MKNKSMLTLLIIGIFVVSLVSSAQVAESQSASRVNNPKLRTGSHYMKINIQSPSEGQEFSQNDPILIKAKVNGARITAVYANVTLPDQTIVELPMTQTGGKNYEVTFTSTSQEGDYNIRVIAENMWGDSNYKEVNVVVLVDNPPVLTSISPTEGTTYEFTGSAPTGDVDYILSANEPLSSATYAIDGEAPSSLTYNSNTGYWESLAGTHPSLSRGQHTISYAATDLGSNPANLDVLFTIRLDATATGCSDASAKLSGAYDQVTLTQSVNNHVGTCITFGADNIIFDGGMDQGVVIDGDGTTDDFGINLNGNSDVTVQNSDVREFDININSESNANNNFIINNHVEGHTNVGIWWVGDGFYVGGNVVENSVGYGHGISAAGSTGNTIIDNTVYFNFGNGMYLLDVDSSIIVDNHIELNGAGQYYGIKLWYGSDNNLIYHNNLINNGNYVYDDGINSWDNGYPSGGNYWTEYDSEAEGCYDDFSGSGQDQSGSDGFCDAAYTNGITDNYPSTTAW